MIDTWLDDQALGVTPRYLDVPQRISQPQRMLELANCFQPDHIIPELEGRTRNSVIEELAGLAARLGLIRDKTWFVGALIQRENVMPSAMGNGVAFLHTLRRNPEQVVKPFMVLGRSHQGVDFDALDGGLTHLIFALGLKYEELYLPWLHKLAQMFAFQGAVIAIMDAPNGRAAFDAVAAAERRLGPESKVAR
jgi:mannitol/fructose-specific phosphotransferase system IIA component (Ntr-type)